MTTSPENHPSEQSPNYRKLITRVGATLKKLEVAEKSLNVRDFRTGVETLSQDFTQIKNISEEFLGEQQMNLQKLCEEVNHPDYVTRLESALKDEEVRFSGAFPDYDIPPFKLSINRDNFTARLNMGKKSQQTNSLLPTFLAKWVKNIHEKTIKNKFNREQFCRELMQAYRYLNPSGWGQVMSIKDIYRVLTIRAESKQEYPEPEFIFDLSRLLPEYEIKYSERDGTQYTIDLSAHAQASKNYTVVSVDGKETAIGNINIKKL